MKPEWCDEKTWATADHLFRCSSADVIALAIMRAERRGMEKAAGMIEESELYPYRQHPLNKLAAAIRAKAQEVSS